MSYIPPIRPTDPLQILTHEALFPEERESGGSDEEQRRQDEERLFQIWKSFYPELDEEMANAKALKLKRPFLKELAKKLNSTPVQVKIREKIKLAEREPKETKEGFLLLRNLEKINEKIDKANQVWFRKIPLVSRVFNLIDRIRIP